MFKIRDIRCGNGNRNEFYARFIVLYRRAPSLALALLDKIPIYGGWMDIIHLRGCGLGATFVREVDILIRDRLAADELAMHLGYGYISLLGKWLPREGNKGGAQAREIARWLWDNEPISHRYALNYMASYRKRCSALNRVLGTVEVLECSNRWSQINPVFVPNVAVTKRWNSFLNVKESYKTGKEDCRERFIRWVEDGAPTVKIESWFTRNRYEIILTAIQSWAEGGWRGIL